MNASPGTVPSPLRPRTARTARGFTLVEVLVALMAMALLAGLAWQGMDTITRTRETTREALDRTQRLATVVTQWEQDLQAVYDTLAVPPLAFDGRTLRLTRRVEGGVVLVAWSVTAGVGAPSSNANAAAVSAAAGTGGGDGVVLGASAGIGAGPGIWQRWVSPTVQRVADLQEAWVGSQGLLGNEPGQLTLLQGVSEWQIYFHRGGAWSNAQSSGDLDAAPAAAAAAAAASAAAGAAAGIAAPPPAAASAPVAVAALRELLPAAVRMVLTVNGRTLTRDVSLGPAAGPGS
jgi:general secretion pathway protein J